MAKSDTSAPSRLRKNFYHAASVVSLINPFSDADSKKATANAAHAIRSSKQLERIDAILADHNKEVVDFANRTSAQH